MRLRRNANMKGLTKSIGDAANSLDLELTRLVRSKPIQVSTSPHWWVWSEKYDRTFRHHADLVQIYNALTRINNNKG